MLKAMQEGWDGRKYRQAERSAVAMTASLRLSGAEAVAIQIRNLSPRGFMAECDMIGLIGRYVWITLPGHGEVNARVMWSVAGRIGGQFMQPLTAADCDALRAANPA